jgi:hypothetical protein
MLLYLAANSPIDQLDRQLSMAHATIRKEGVGKIEAFEKQIRGKMEKIR